MFDTAGRDAAARTGPPPLKVEFFTAQFSPLATGEIMISVGAVSLDEEEPGLLNQELARECVTTLDEALAVLRRNVAFA